MSDVPPPGDAGATRNPELETRSGVEVAAGLIFREGKLLIAQRHAEAHLGGLWEFPGGKREAGESYEQCLQRELQEELGVTVVVGELFETVDHAYPEKAVHLRFFLCQLAAGEPQAHGCAAVRWVGRTELEQFEFPAADAGVLTKLLQSERFWHWPDSG